MNRDRLGVIAVGLVRKTSLQLSEEEGKGGFWGGGGLKRETQRRKRERVLGGRRQLTVPTGSNDAMILHLKYRRP